MHLVLVNNNITASSSDEKTLSSFLLYLRAYSLDGVSIGTAFFFFFSPLCYFSRSLLHEASNTYIHRRFFSFSFASSRALGRSMLDDDHFACNLYCLLFFFLFSFVLLLDKAHFFFSLSFERPHTYASKTILDMCKAVAFLLLLFPILFDGETRASLFDFSSLLPATTEHGRAHCLLDSLFTYMCSYVKNDGRKRTQ